MNSIIYQLMLSLKKYQKQGQSPKILNFQIPLDNLRILKGEGLASRKIKKLQLSDRMKQSKIVNILENLQFQNLVAPKISSPIQHQQQPSKNGTNRMSSYLAYKQQKILKTKHNNKIGFLKKKYIQKKQAQHSIERQYYSERQICTEGEMRNHKKANVIELRANVPTDKELRESLNRREVYMKTSTGKRQKVNTNMYLGKIKAKLDSNNSHQSKITISFARFPEYLQSQSIFPIRSFSTPLNLPRRSQNHLNFRRHSLKKQKRTLLVTPNDTNSFRPWTSDNSELQQ